MRTVLSLWCVVIAVIQCSAQFTFNPNALGMDVIRYESEYGQGVTVYDVNLDGLDDITFVQTNDSLLVFEATSNGFILRKPVFTNGEAKHALYGDYDNDGDPDLFVSVYKKPILLFRNDGNWLFTDVTSQVGLGSLPFRDSYGASWGDVNNDGWLDLFVSNNDQGPVGCWLFRNNQGQSFTDISNSWGVNIGNEFSFQSTFFDHNMDGLQDVHVCNDRFPPDALLVNYGSFFINEAVGNGLDVPCDGMCSAVADYNQDGRYDIYVSDNPPGNKLWEKNEQGYYTNVASDHNVTVNRVSWGSTWIDWDNNSWEDLFVNNQINPGDDLPFFYNNSGTFLRNVSIAGYTGISSYSSAKGDFNNDGFPDLVVSPIPGIPARVVMNIGNDNNYLKFRLQGQVSNRDGIGSHIRCYRTPDDPNIIVRYTRAGDGFLSQDSQWNIIGLGENDTIYRLDIQWLSGKIDTYYNLVADSAYVFIEGYRDLSIVDSNNSLLPSQISLCPNDSILLNASTVGDIVWNDGYVGQQRWIGESGVYSYTITDDYGIENTSNEILIEVAPESELVLVSTNVSCFGEMDGTITWTANELWQPDFAPQENYASGVYNLSWTYASLCTQPAEVIITEPDPLVFSFEQESEFDDVIPYSISGGTPPYSLNISQGEIFGDTLVLFVGQFLVELQDANGCIEFAAISVEQEQEFFQPEFYYVTNIDELANSSLIDATDIRVYNSLGSIVYTSKTGTLNMNHLSTGIYFIHYLVNDKLHVAKFYKP